MTDSLQTIIQTIKDTSGNGIDLINKVDSFYNSAWDKLVLVGSIAFTVLGIIVPFVIQWYQKQSLKVSEEKLKQDLKDEVSKIKSELLEVIDSKLEEKFRALDLKVEKLDASITAKIFHLQGNNDLSKQLYSGALSDFIRASENYLDCEDHLNLQIVLTSIEDCLDYISLEEIEDIKISSDSDLESLLEKINEYDNNATFLRSTRKIRLIVSKLPKTIADKPTHATH